MSQGSYIILSGRLKVFLPRLGCLVHTKAIGSDSKVELVVQDLVQKVGQKVLGGRDMGQEVLHSMIQIDGGVGKDTDDGVSRASILDNGYQGVLA